jgi:hypothetical protein
VLFDQRKHDGIRGPAAGLHAANKSETVWQQWDRLIFLNLRLSVPPSYFEAFFNGSAERRRRAGLLLRASIMARHCCWDEAVLDFEEASNSCQQPLAIAEILACRRASDGKHGFETLLERPDLLGRLKAMGRTQAGIQIQREFVHGSAWRIHWDDLGSKLRALKLFWHAAGLTSLFALARKRDFTWEEQHEDEVCEFGESAFMNLLPPDSIPPVRVSTEGSKP